MMAGVDAENKAAFHAATKVLVGGVNSPVRSFKSVGGTPVFFKRGRGQRLYDLADRPYLDYVLSWGALILGHAHPRVIAALKQTLERGTSFGAPTELETRLAEQITRCVPGLELVRMVNSGTEAVMSLVRLARGATGREKIIKFRGCYHGHGDSFLVEAGSGALTLGVPSSPGVTAGSVRDSLLADFNDSASVEKLLDEHSGNVAAILVEPVPGNMGVILPESGFLMRLRELATAHGALLIFDEVMTGFRVSLTGVAGHVGITPDLMALGKILGGGLPAALYGGRRDLMEQVAPLGPVYQAGTLSGNPLAMTSGLETLLELKEHEAQYYNKLEHHGEMLATGLRQAAKTLSVPVCVTRMGSMLTVFFTHKSQVRNYEDVCEVNSQAYGVFFHEMLKAGIFLPPSPYEAWFLSVVHTVADIEQTVQAAQHAFKKVLEHHPTLATNKTE